MMFIDHADLRRKFCSLFSKTNIFCKVMKSITLRLANLIVAVINYMNLKMLLTM